MPCIFTIYSVNVNYYWCPGYADSAGIGDCGLKTRNWEAVMCPP